MRLTVLNVAYPLAPVTAAGGGAEQILARLDAGVVARGHRSLVIAQEGSEVCGRLIPVPPPPPVLSHTAYAHAERQHLEVIGRVLRAEQVDVLHLHGVDFSTYLPRNREVPTIVTLHLPRAWYHAEARDLRYPGVTFVCVSRSQARSWPGQALEVIDNGIAMDDFGAAVSRRRHAVMLGRICPEKAWHLGFDAAALAGVPAILAGALHRFPEHERYFDEEIAPRLRRGRAVYAGVAAGARKRRLLASAACVLIPSQAPETSSLVAIEALASSTPVVAFARGALTEVVEHGRTGFLVESVEEMAEAIEHVHGLNPEACRGAVAARYDANRMVDAYLGLYEREAARRRAASLA
jgi:glycosyltransferase involved in cell wall biosynthesis